MGGETEAQVSSWTVDSLKEHLEQRIDDLAARLLERQEAQDKAILKSEVQMEKRFDSVNEFRGQLADQVKTFMTRETYEVGHAALESKVSLVENMITGIVAEKRGSNNLVNGIYAFVGFAFIVGTVLAANGIFN